MVPWEYDEETDVYTDQWGLGYKKNPGGYYYDFYRHPLADAQDIKDLDKYQFPDPYCESTLIEIFKEGGGYVFAQVHNIMPEVPIENIIAMYEAYREFADY